MTLDELKALPDSEKAQWRKATRRQLTNLDYTRKALEALR